MMKRNFIFIAMGGLLVLFIAGQTGGAHLLWAADSKAALSSQTGGTKAPSVKALSTPQTGEKKASSAKLLPTAVPASGTTGPSQNPVPIAASPMSLSATYEYFSTGKADPFRPFMEIDPAVKARMEEEVKKLMAKKAVPVSPLQRADISQFRLVGTAGDETRCVAVVEDSVSKKYYPLHVGTYIGQNRGRVAEILQDRVVVEERAEMQDKAKKVKVKRLTLMLYKEEKEEGKP
jgi:Tfp pilus assembly protein PilP